MKAYQSSQVEWLADRLGEQLYDRKDPFLLPMVVIPNQAIKEYLCHRWAATLGIVMGVRFQFLEETIVELAGLNRPFPNRFEITCRIREVLEKADLGPPSAYIQKGEGRLVSLSHTLALPLMRWGVYGGKLESWLEKLARGVYAEWKTPLQLLEGRTAAVPPPGIHLFGFSHIPPLYFNCLPQNTCLYLFSPCAQFWTDTFREKEAHALHVDQKINPLLADWGKLHRRLLKQVEEIDAEVTEYYPVPAAITKLSEYEEVLGGELTFVDLPLTRLSALQADLLTMRSEPFHAPGETLEIHAAPSRYREVEVCAEAILRRLREGARPEDWVIMAPNIALYLPYIEAVFEREQIPFRALRMGRPDPNSLEGGLIQLARLIGSRFEASRLMSLLRHPLVGFSEEELALFESWIREAGIHWGKGREHWEEILGSPVNGSGWQEGLGRLFRALACLSEEGGLSVEISQAEALGRCSGLIQMLIERLSTAEQMITDCVGWATFWGELSRELFGRAPPFSWMGSLTCDQRIPFDQLKPHLEWEWGEIPCQHYPHRLEGALCISLLPMQFRPTPHLFLLGMDEESFPKRQREGPFRAPLPGLPNAGEFDRALFLEILHGAKKSLAISYCERSLEDGAPQNPSPLVTDLVAYLGKSSDIIRHPSLGQEEATTYSETLYQRAINRRCPPKKRELAPLAISGEITLDLRDLRMAAADPIRLHCRTLGIDPERRESLLEDEEAVGVDPIDAALRAWSLAGHPGSFRTSPIEGPFAPIFEQRIAAEGRALQDRLKGLTGDRSRMVKLVQGAGRGELSPLEVKLEQNVQIRLVGELGPITKEGMLVFGKGKQESLIRAFPHFLVLACLIDGHLLDCKPTLHLIREGMQLSAPKDPWPLLKRYLRYTLRCLEEPSPIGGDHLAAVLQGKKEGSSWGEEAIFSWVKEAWA